MVGLRKTAFAEESAEVEVLYANLDKMKSLTKKIQGSMGRLETSGRTVQDAIGPVYGNTQKLQTTNSNIDRIIMAIDRIREPLDMRNQEERIIRANPQRVGLAEYMSSIDRTRSALRDMKQTNLKSNQQAISELNGLLQAGNQQLEDVFRDALRDTQQPVEPLHFITKNVGFPTLDQGKTDELRTINAYVASSAAELVSGQGRPITATAKIYAEIRGQYLTYSLQNLSTASIQTARKQNADAIYKRGENAIGTYAAGIRAIYAAEFENISRIFAEEEWGQILSMTCKNSMTAFANTLRELDKHIREHMMSDCFLAYDIIEAVSNSSLQLETQTGAGEVKHEMADAVKPIRETAKAALPAFLTEIRNEAQRMQQLPMDGSSVNLSSDAIRRLQTLTEYLISVSSILTSLGDGGWTSPNLSASTNSIPTLRSFDVGPDGKLLFAHYIGDTIETLMSNLQMRAHAALRTKALQGIFLLNNLVVVERMIRNSELYAYLDSNQPKIDAWRKKATALYLDTWKETSSYLLDVQYTNRAARPPSTGQAIDSAAIVKALSSKDKDSIKEKFRSFNTSFEENVQRHKNFKMEKETRTHLAREVQLMLDALYSRFYDRYSSLDKGKGKYVKYEKAQVSGWLTNLS